MSDVFTERVGALRRAAANVEALRQQLDALAENVTNVTDPTIIWNSNARDAVLANLATARTKLEAAFLPPSA